jgi:hypothetical protein
MQQTDRHVTELVVAFCNILSVPKKVQFSICLIERHDMKAYGGVLALGWYHDTSVLLLWRMLLMSVVRRLCGRQSWSGALAVGFALSRKQTPFV